MISARSGNVSPSRQISSGSIYLVAFLAALFMARVVSVSAAEKPRNVVRGGKAKTVDAKRAGQDKSSTQPPEVPSPLSPKDSLKWLYPCAGFQVELVAAEPLVIDPVAYDWGPDGKLWVVEMADYPSGLDGQRKPGGRVRYLEDTNGDGRYDKSTLYYQGLGFPNGVMAWGRGVLVTCAPEILYLEDTDGDGKADLRKTLYTGLTEGNPQLRINGLRWGLDNWVYCANGTSSAGKVKSVKTGDAVNIRGHDLRIRPNQGLLDAQMGTSQFGRNQDDWGNWFGEVNNKPMWHFVLADHYVRRNPYYAPPDARVHVSVIPAPGPVYSRSRKGRFFHLSEVGRFTSANNAIIYRGDLLGPEFAGNSFVSEPTHNLVHREIVEPKGVTFTSRRADDQQHSEFLASADTWFRPTTLRTGPDGALWIADMYREIVDHPQYIPKQSLRGLDFRAGDDRGRIYRVYPLGKKPGNIARLDRLEPGALADLLKSPNGTLRDMVQQLIVTQQIHKAAVRLEELASGGKRATCRMQALCTLDGLGTLKPELVRHALADSHPGVRRQAVRLCEGRFDQSPELGGELLKLVDDAAAPVRLQLACTLGQWNDPRAATALARLARKNHKEPYIVAAVMSSAGANHVAGMLDTVLAHTAHGGPPELLVSRLLATAAGFGKKAAIARTLTAITSSPKNQKYAAWQLGALGELLDARGKSGKMSLQELAQLPAAHGQPMQQRLDNMITYARSIVQREEIDEGLRQRAIRLLGRETARRDGDVARLGQLLVPQSHASIQLAAVTALARIGTPQAADALLDGWKGHSPQLRSRVLDALLARHAWIERLLVGIEQGNVAAGELDAARRQRLLRHKDNNIQQRAAKLMAGLISPDRMKVFRQFESALKLPGDQTRGEAVFAKHCANCHRLAGKGHVVGPDLAGLSDKSPPALLREMLDPNRAVEPRYISYTAVTTEGRIYTGIISAETGISITLLAPDGKQQVLLRAELEELQTTGKSLMPEGIEKDVTPQDLADVMAYIAGATAGGP